MSLRTLFTRPAAPRRLHRSRPRLETLEGRLLLACDQVLWNQHVDVEVEYEDGALALVLHDESSDQTCVPEETFLYVGPSALTTQPAGWDFIGAGAGNPYWRLTQVREDPDLLVIGGAAEEVDPEAFDAYRPADARVTSRSEWLKVTLRELYGPGHVSVWRDNQVPQQWWISSHDGGRTYEPAFYVAAGAHVDFNWGFSAPGIYLVGLEASGFQGGSGLPLRSPVTYYWFYVDGGSAPAPIPGRQAVPLTESFLLESLAPAAAVLQPAPSPVEVFPEPFSGLPETQSRPASSSTVSFLPANPGERADSPLDDFFTAKESALAWDLV